MKANGRMTRPTEWVTTCTRMELPTTGSGRTTSSTEMELKLGLMGLAMKARTTRARSMAEGRSNLLMEVSTQEISNIMKFPGEGSTFGLMEKHTMGNGKRIKCMVTESSRGRTGKDMRGTS